MGLFSPLFSPVLKANILLGANKMAGQISLLVRHIIFLLIIYFYIENYCPCHRDSEHKNMQLLGIHLKLKTAKY